MNKNVFRLVFSQCLGMYVPASEAVSGRGGKGTSSLRSRRRALMALLAASGLHALPAMADQPAGLVRATGANSAWKNATIDAARSSANTLTIKQSAAKAILNWSKFNLERNQTVNFDQASRSWVALNRIFDANPSTINGTINALGHVYLVNTNGIIFGNGAQINVGSLTAGSFDIKDSLFEAGILSGARKDAVFEGTTGFVMVEAGAALNAATGGSIMLLAPNVTNKGVITTPQGQTILAAGEKVYLGKSKDPAGLLVEVSAGGTATNIGDIVAKLGNVTMVGLAVNQQGRVSASTSVRANGSIILKARDTNGVDALEKDAISPLAPNNGVLTLAKGSVTQVEVEASDKEEILKAQLTDKDGNKLLAKSTIDMLGAVIDINGNVIARGGDVSAVATDGGAGLKPRVYLGKDAFIDVSGLDATAPMSRNQLEFQLFSAQLKDTPLLRGTDLVGKTVYVDARKGTDLINADELKKVSDAKGITIAEALSKAGTVNLNAANGDVILNAGSTIDLSGGSITYDAGNIRESQLVYKGRAVDISKADKTTPYEGLTDTFTVTNKKWNRSYTYTRGGKGAYNLGYTQGADAGGLSIVAQNALLQANLYASTLATLTQRASAPLGGSFNFTLTPNSTPINFELVGSNQSVLPQDFVVVGGLDAGTGSYTQGSQTLNGDVQLATTLFSNGFNRFNVNAGSNNVVVNAPVAIAPNGSFNLNGGTTTVNANITAPSGNVTIAGSKTVVADNVKISTSGLYTNDTAGLGGALNSALALTGGSVTVKSTNTQDGGLFIGKGVALEANAGAWVDAAGELTTGSAGEITVNGLTSFDGLSLSAFGFNKGGSLTLSTPLDLQVGGLNPLNSNTLWAPEALFKQGGFSQYTITAGTTELSKVLVGDAADTTTLIKPQAQLLELNGDYRAQANGSAIEKITQKVLPIQAQASSVAITSTGSLTVAENATIHTGTPESGSAGKIELKSATQMNILGDLIAPAGTITASIGGKPANTFDPTISLFVGEKALLSAAGQYVVTPSTNRLLNAKVLDAGTINLDGGRDAVVITKQGSVLDVSGAFGQTDVKLPTSIERQTKYGAAGAVNIGARSGALLDGDMRASAVGTGYDGTLNIQFTGLSESEGGFPENRLIRLTQNKQNLSQNINAGDNAALAAGEAVIAVSAKQIQEAGFGSLSLDAGVLAADKLLIADDVNLKLQDSLAIKSTLIEVENGAKATLAADYVALTSDTATRVATAGTGELKVDAKWIDVAGNIAVSGVDKTTLTASLDIRGVGISSLETTGDVTLKARQVYPATASTFKIQSTGEGRTIEVVSNGAPPTLPLSAGGELILKADTIVQGGVLRAPLGQITLDAKDNQLTLGAGSLTSISAEGKLIPYGSTTLGGLQFFKPSARLLDAETDGQSDFIKPKVDLKGRSVDAQAGAVVDISGGGDTFAYEWINGIGGSSDILGQPGVYAVLPSLKGEYAPFDFNYNMVRSPLDAQGVPINAEGIARTDIKAGDSVYLSGVKGLADGQYTLLPARYALMPGAYTVQTTSQALGAERSVVQLDGSTLVSGYRANGNNRATDDAVFRVASADVFRPANGAVSRAPAEYRINNGNQFFTDLAAKSGVNTPRLVTDAGQLAINAGEKLTLDLTVKADKAQGARGSIVDISSDNIEVVSTVDAGVTDALQLTSESLNNLNAESLLLGGVRTGTADGFSVETSASKVTFANDAANPINALELIATAKDTVTVKSGASINSLASTAAIGNTRISTTGDGALLAVSSLSDFDYSRSVTNKATGTLNLEAGANVSAKRSMVLDATVKSNIDGTATVADGGSLTLGADSIILGDTNENVAGLRVNDSLIDSFGKLAKVSLNSNQNIEVYGPVSLGNDQLDLTLNAGGIAGHTAANQTATFTARDFTLKNSAGAGFATATAAQGSVLNVQASNIELAGESKSTTKIAGFEQVNLNAKQEVKFSGTGTTEIDALQTNIKSTRISALTAADYALKASGSLSTSKADVAAVLANVTGLGAKLNLTGANVALGGNVVMPSGSFTAQATTGNLTVAGDANINVASSAVKFDRFTEYTPGGKATLQADNGNVVVDTGAVVDVSGGEGGNAGTVVVNAVKGSATIAANTLKGQALAANQAGSFVLDAATVTDLSGLNNTLNAGGFTKLRDMRIRTGDVSIAAGDTITAQQFKLSADGGKIDIAGTIDANGNNGGNIAINARDTLTLKSTAKLLARGTGDNLVEGDKRTGAGGSVQLGSLSRATINAVSAETGALIDVSGDAQGTVKGAKGDVTMRAYRGTTGNTNTVNVAFNSTAAVKGAEAVRLDAVRVYDSPTFAFNTKTIVADTNAFYNANPNTGAGNYAATQDGAGVLVLPEIELRSTAANTPADLAVSADTNLRAFGTGAGALQAGKGGKLTLRSNRDLNINGTLSDGFNGVATTSALQAGNTFSYDLVAGADYTAANVMQTVAGVGNMRLASDKLIRTGQGDIRIATGGNLTLGNDASVIYTVGQAAANLAGFVAPTTSTGATSNGVNTASYLRNGGDITINTRGDITGALGASNRQQLANNWLFREGAGSGNRDLTWWVRPDLFRAGVATFGGGDVTVNAGGSVTNFSAAAPTTARFDSFNGAQAGTGAFSVDGGGDVSITSGKDIVNGVYHAGRGEVSLNAAESIRKTAGAFGTTLSLQDASAKVYAANDVFVETIHNPTMLNQSRIQATGATSSAGISPYFVSYGEQSGVKLESLTGNAAIGTATAISATNVTNINNSGLNAAPSGAATELLPGNLAITAYSGNISSASQNLTLAPSPKGNFSLLAAGDVQVVTISLSDADTRLLSDISDGSGQSGELAIRLRDIRNSHAASPIHLGNKTPVSIVAKNGSIRADGIGTGDNRNPGIASAKAAYIVAGKDIAIDADIQHVNADDITVIRAGRDINMPLATAAQMKLGGQGDLLVAAGRDVNLGSSLGIVTVANTQNPNLPKEGASITVLAGLGKEGANVETYVNDYINPLGAGPSEVKADAKKLAAYREGTAKAVGDYMRGLNKIAAYTDEAVGAFMRGLNGKAEKDYSNAVAMADYLPLAMTQYLALDKDKQSIFAYRHFSSELLASAKGSTDPSKQQRGDAAIASLFPKTRTYSGDLALFNSQLRTLRNGSIDILTPGGFINAGVPTSAGENIGIITEFGGDIRAFAETGFQVEQSKVITQYGSNITVWANNGDIDAGRGSKTALSTPTREVSTDADGNTTIEVKGSAAGSGIRAQTYDLDGPTGELTAPKLGDVALIAPRGVLNAGEAGIGAGNFIGVATVVLGANNISVAGSSSGIPVADTGSLAGSLAGTTNAVSDSTKSITSDLGRQATQNAVKPTQSFIPSIISVDVISIGD